jgi:rubrerythrin
MQDTTDPQFHKWNEYLLNELTASETYREAAENVKDELVRDQLQQCEASHRNRAQKLECGRQELGIASGVKPQIWHSFASLLAEGAFKDKDAVQLLEGEEEIGLQMYREDNAHLDDHDPLRDLLQSTLLPEQSKTHDALNILRLSLS